MSDNDDNKYDINGRDANTPAFEDKFSHLDEKKKEKAEKTVEKLAVIRQVRELNKDSQWLVTQEMMQEIIANHIVANPNGKIPSAPKLTEELKAAIQEQYSDNIEIKELLLDSIPAPASVREWLKKDGWEEAVWGKIRLKGLFNKEKRAEMINALFQRGVTGSDVAAKIWLTLSGDYSDKMDINTDKRIEAYREVNEILHNKKE